MEKHLALKLVVNAEIAADLNPVLYKFIDEGLKNKCLDGILSSYSFRLSCNDPEGTIHYHILLTRKASKGLDPNLIIGDILRKVTNRKIDHSDIRSIHLHLIYE